MQQEYLFTLESGPAALADLASYLGDAPHTSRIARRAIASIEKRLTAEKKEAVLSSTHDEEAMQARGKKALEDVLASLDFVFDGAADIYALYEKSKPAFTDYAKVVVQRTYSGDKDGVHETWADIVVRVISATFYFRKVQLLSLENTCDADAVFSRAWEEEVEQARALHMARSMYAVRWLPPGRGLQMMRRDLVRRIGSMVLNNCGFVSTGYCPRGKGAKRLAYFNERKRAHPYGAPRDSAEERYAAVESFLDAIEWGASGLMSGVGIGFDAHFNELLIEPLPETEMYVVPDTREGWAHSFRLLYASYLHKDRRTMAFDYHLIRPKGARIRTFGGTASGPGVLRLAHARLRASLNCLLRTQRTHAEDVDDRAAIADFLRERLPAEMAFFEEEGGDVPLERAKIERAIQSVERSPHRKTYGTTRALVDGVNIIGCCIVMGGLRHTAEIVLGSPDDAEFFAVKDYAVNPERTDVGGCSNNSIQIYDKSQYVDVSRKLASCVGVRGEPGLINMVAIWRSPAVHDAFLDKHDRELCDVYGDLTPLRADTAEGINPCGETPLESYELCCLAEVYPCNADIAGWMSACTYAALFASVVTCIPTCSERTNRVVARNHRLGVSQTGLFQFYESYDTASEYLHDLRHAYLTIRRDAAEYVRRVTGVTPIRTTVVKPSGTISPLGNAPPGIHPPPIARYVIRRIRIARNKSLADTLIARGVPYEVKIGDPTTLIFEFPIDQGDMRCADAVSMWELGPLAIDTAEWYADNAVSFSNYLNVHRDTPRQIEAFLRYYIDRIKSISFAPNATERQLPLADGAILRLPQLGDYSSLVSLLQLDETTLPPPVEDVEPSPFETAVRAALKGGKSWVAADDVKAFSQIPNTAYPQSPYEIITCEQYHELLAAMPSFEFDGTPFVEGDVDILRGCDGLQCSRE